MYTKIEGVMSEKIIISKITAEDTYVIRHQVLRSPDQELSSAFFEGDKLPTTIHLGAHFQNNLVGVLSLYINSPDYPELDGLSMQIRGVAVKDRFQGKGIGRVILTESITRAKELEVKYLWCNARTHVTDFYKSFDFKIHGNEFEVLTVGPHYRMVLKL